MNHKPVDTLWQDFLRMVMQAKQEAGTDRDAEQEDEMSRVYKAGAFDLFVYLFAGKLQVEELKRIEAERRAWMEEIIAYGKSFHDRMIDASIKAAAQRAAKKN